MKHESRKSIGMIIVLLMIVLTSCSKNEKNFSVTEIDGIKVFQNKSTPSDSTFTIKPKEVFTIEGSDENCRDSLRNISFMRSTVVDSDGNIYILDGKLAEIKKFDKSGNFLKSFGRLGTGPGEFQGATVMFCLNDTLNIKDASSNRYSKFTTNGDFLESFIVEGLSHPQFETPVGTNLFINDNLEYTQFDKSTILLSLDLQIRNNKYELIKSIRKDQGEYLGKNTKYHDYVHPFCVGKKNIYVAKISENDYLIDVLDFNGELIYKIRKDFRKMIVTEEEFKEFMISQNLALGVNDKIEYKVTYKKAIDAMSVFEDKNGNLIVQVPLERNENNKFDFIVDAFKDGVFINRFKMDIGKAFDFYNSSHQRFFIGDRIYYQNREDNCVTVYEY